jgi:hypothetical protein
MQLNLLKNNICEDLLNTLRDRLKHSEVVTLDDFNSSIKTYDLIVAVDDCNNLLGYAIFAPYSSLRPNNILDDLYEPDRFDEYVDSLNNNLANGVYLKGLEVFPEHQDIGVGSALFNEILKLKVPILLYSLGESISFWEEKGFDMFEEGGYWEIYS